MNINLPSRVRSFVYLVSVVVNAVAGAFVANGEELPILAVAVLAGLNALVAALARVNVTPDVE